MPQFDRNSQKEKPPRGNEPSFNWRGVILIAMLLVGCTPAGGGEHPESPLDWKLELVVVPVVQVELNVVESFDEGSRGAGGFDMTGARGVRVSSSIHTDPFPPLPAVIEISIAAA